MSTAVFEGENPNNHSVNLGEQSSVSTEASPPPAAFLTQILLGSLASQTLYVAAKLGIADHLVDGPKSVEDLAKATDTDAPSLYRVLRALASLGVFTEQDGRKFALTPTAEPLRSDVPDSLRDVAIFWGEDWHWDVWGKILYSVRTGKSAWGQTHGEEVFSFFEKNPEAAQVFNRAMSSFSSVATAAVIEAYDFGGIETLVDIAGGHGRMLTGILEANPKVRGVLFDLPHVIAGAREQVAASKAAERVEFVDGDFFAEVPEGGDAYIMKHIIHDWDDERALTILKNIKRAMKPGGRVLLVEAIIADGNNQDFGKLLDIEMLVSPGGKERTANEYRELFARAGLNMTRIVPTKSPYSVIEAVAA
ncbi:MAG: acetylserotonin O-methyltransferase [Acidobacteria bacterium]|nr:acetylserotonin O-methyltransferase [Acidobacteriota bacterium]